jgi:cell division transport system permease protein
MPWVIAIMVLLTAIAAASGMALRNAAHAASADLSGGVTVQIVTALPAERARQANNALATLRTAPGVAHVRLVPQDEVDALIEPWLGTRSNDPAAADALPIPALIDARLTGPVDEPRLEALRKRLAPVAPAARVDAQAGWLEPVFDALASLQWLALALIVLLAVATGAAVLLATRTALNTHRATIEIIHLLGGTDGQIARVFQRSIAIDAMAGSALGLGLAVVVVQLLARQFGQLGSGAIAAGSLGWLDWAALGLVPLGAIALSAITARFAVFRALKAML